MDLRRTRDRPPPRPVNSTTRSSPTTQWLTALLKAARRVRERPLEPQVNAEARWRYGSRGRNLAGYLFVLNTCPVMSELCPIRHRPRTNRRPVAYRVPRRPEPADLAVRTANQ